MISMIMNMKRQFLLFILCLLVWSSHGAEGVTYYVKPSQSSSECPGQPCETLQYYLDNVNTTLNQEENVTMIFLTGNHTVRPTVCKYHFIITAPIIRMIGNNGESDVKIVCQNGGGLDFYNNSLVVFKNLWMVDWSTMINEKYRYRNGEFLISSVVLLNPCFVHIAIMPQAFRMENSVIKNGACQLRFFARHSKDFSLYNSSFYDTVGFVIHSKADMTARVQNCTFVNTPLTITKGNIILSGATVFRDVSYSSAISSYQGNITLSGVLLFLNNSADRGGAMALYSSTLNIDANTVVTFTNNSAAQLGGAIYISPGAVPVMVLYDADRNCAYQLLNCSNSTYQFKFEGNSATSGGDDIYGISLIEINDGCHGPTRCHLSINGASSNNSSISSDPLRVCMCDDHGKPQCESNSYTFMNGSVYPGEVFMFSLVVVGGDFGLTVGTVYASIYPDDFFNTTSLSPDYGQDIRSISTCTKVNYSLYSPIVNSSVIVFLSTIQLSTIQLSTMSLELPCKNGDQNCFLHTQVSVNFTILPCPPGFILLDNPPQCSCYSIFTETLNITCHLTKGTGYFSWTGDLWMDVLETETLYDEYCPHNYCKKGTKQIDVRKSSSNQCDFNRAGQLCGQCNDSHSLAIGSSNCIHCQTNNNLSLIIFFAAAGLLLVFCIGALNVTVTLGTINGLIFYANIVWTYKDIFFTQEGSKNAVMIFLKTFIAWLNLDFGIETCFVKGLNAFWKTWLQFVFPFYIWIIAGLIIVATRQSTKLTSLLGNRAVPLLATLFLLSYMKLLRTVVSSLEFSILSRIDYTRESSSQLVVWSVDGSLGYFEFPHILLFLAGLFTLLFLWMPYTLLLFLMQWLRRLPQHGPLKWIMRFNPLYDAYFAPLKPKHHYWFGALLLARGILLVTFASSFAIPQDINLLLLLIIGMFLVYYMLFNHPYKSSGILILQSSYLINLLLLSGFFFFAYRQQNGSIIQSVAIGLSTGLAFLQFCGTIIHAVIAPWCCNGPNQVQCEEDNEPSNRMRAGYSVNDGYRDSIFDESKPLLSTT